MKNNDQTASDKANVDVRILQTAVLGAEEKILYELQVKYPGASRIGSMLRQGIEESFRETSGTPISVCKVPGVGRGRKRSTWIASLPLDVLAELIAKAHSWDQEGSETSPYAS